jgi:glycosyltransferase involved in cell wall biosynthesis
METSRIPVAVWTSTFQAGGTERQMAHLVRGLDPARFEVHALCFAARGCWLRSVEERARSVVEFPIGSFSQPKTWGELRRYSRWCRDHGIRIVVASDFYTNVFGLTGAAFAGVPVRIGGRREINTDKTLAKLALQRGAYAMAHRVVANSHAAAARLSREGVGPGKIAVVPNGVDADAFAIPRPARAIRRAITVANLRAEKGHDVLIEAIAALGPAASGLDVQFAGDGPCRPALERLVEERGLGERIRFLGERHDLPRLLEEADLFILPSRTEAFPNSVMEAMAAGLPVIASGVGGILELVDDGVSGVLVPADEPAALARAITDVIGDPVRAAAMGRTAQEMVRARFSTQQMVSAFDDLFTRELLRNNGRVAGAATAHTTSPIPNHINE